MLLPVVGLPSAGLPVLALPSAGLPVVLLPVVLLPVRLRVLVLLPVVGLRAVAVVRQLEPRIQPFAASYRRPVLLDLRVP